MHVSCWVSRWTGPVGSSPLPPTAPGGMSTYCHLGTESALRSHWKAAHWSGCGLPGSSSFDQLTPEYLKSIYIEMFVVILPLFLFFWGKIWDLASRPGWPSTHRKKKKFIRQGVLTQTKLFKTKRDNRLLSADYSNHLSPAGVRLVERSPSKCKALGTLETRLCGCDPGTWKKKQKIRVILGWKLSFRPTWATWHRFQINKCMNTLSKALWPRTVSPTTKEAGNGG